MRLTSGRNVYEHIMKMQDLAAQLKILELEMSVIFLAHYILSTLPAQYSPYKISYNTHKDKWSINEIMTMCIQEDGRLLMEIGESEFMTTQGKKTNKSNKSYKGKEPLDTDIKKKSKCRFCRKKGHIRQDCVKFQQ